MGGFLSQRKTPGEKEQRKPKTTKISEISSGRRYPRWRLWHELDVNESNTFGTEGAHNKRPVYAHKTRRPVGQPRMMRHGGPRPVDGGTSKKSLYNARRK